MAEFSVNDGVPIQLLLMEGVDGSIASVESGTFPLPRPLNLATKGDVSPLSRAFLDHASSPAVKDLVEGQHFVPIANRPRAPDLDWGVCSRFGGCGGGDRGFRGGRRLAGG